MQAGIGQSIWHIVSILKVNINSHYPMTITESQLLDHPISDGFCILKTELGTSFHGSLVSLNVGFRVKHYIASYCNEEDVP